MHDRLFANQKALEPWNAHAEAIGLDVPKFEGCLTAGKQGEEVRKDMAEAKKAGVTGTPVFFLAYTEPGSSKVKTVVRLAGAQPFSVFKAQIDRLLAAEPKAEVTPEKQK